MAFKTRKVLLLGLALMILGPATGWLLSIIGLFLFMPGTILPATPGLIPDLRQFTAGMFAISIPAIIGFFSAALGLFLTLYALVTHFFGPGR